MSNTITIRAASAGFLIGLGLATALVKERSLLLGILWVLYGIVMLRWTTQHESKLRDRARLEEKP